MKRIISLALLVVTATAGSAMADHYRGRDYRDNRAVVRDHRIHTTRDYRHVDHRPVYVNNNRYVFNGYSRPYVRPVIQYRYTNYRQRPQLLIENYEDVGGYIWIPGEWQWSGYEWNWIAGHYQADPGYQNAYSSYDSDPGCNH